MGDNSSIIFIFVIVVLAVTAACIFHDPFRGTYPYFRMSFDFSRKRGPEIKLYIQDALVNEMRWKDMRRHHYKTVGAWKARCDDRVSRSLFKSLRRRQYERACDDGHEFVFTGTRSQARYRQQNYVRHRYDVQVVDSEMALSFDQLLEWKDRLAPGTLEMKDFVALQRKLMTEAVRERIMRRDNFTCQVCGRYMPDRVGIHIDHIVPVSKGGRTEDGNLRVTCSVCNLSKGNKM